MNKLVVIPARGGSKGILRKNIKPLNGKPLIYYTIDIARSLVDDSCICMTSDDDEIISVTEAYGLKVPFKRPAYLSTDNMGTYDVLLHALDYYEAQGEKIDVIVLLQVTSPFRLTSHLSEALDLYSDDIDMVVSVKETAVNPYYNCFEENCDGYLRASKGDGNLTRRQDAPPAYEYNGSIYIINVKSLKSKNMSAFEKVIKYQMPSEYSVDIDNPFDWKIAELMINELK